MAGTGVRELDELDLLLSTSLKPAPRPKPAPKKTEALDVEALLMQLIDEPVKPPPTPPVDEPKASLNPPTTAHEEPQLPPPGALPAPLEVVTPAEEEPVTLILKPAPPSNGISPRPQRPAPGPPSITATIAVPAALETLPPPLDLAEAPPIPDGLPPPDALPPPSLPPPSLPPPIALPPLGALPPQAALPPPTFTNLPPIAAVPLPPLAFPLNPTQNPPLSAPSPVVKQLINSKGPMPSAVTKEQLVGQNSPTIPRSTSMLPPEPMRPISLSESQSTAAALLSPSTTKASPKEPKNDRIGVTMPASMRAAAVSMLNNEKDIAQGSISARAAPQIVSPRAERRTKDTDSTDSPAVLRSARSHTDGSSVPRPEPTPRLPRFRDLVMPLQLSTLSPQEVTRHEAFYEILLSERAYVDALQILQTSFAVPLSKGTVLSKPDVSSLLLNYEAIINTNRLFLAALEEVVAANKPFIAEVGDVFSRFSAQFKLYVSYCANNSEVLERLDELRGSQFKFANWLDEPSRKPEGKTFGHYLQLPVQRVGKYPSLLQALLAATPESSTDHKLLAESLKEYELLVDAVKDRTRRVGGMRKVAEIAVNIKIDALPKHFDLKQLGRYYITEGSVKVAKGKKTEKEMYWFLFSDLLLETKKPKHGKFAAVRATSLNTLLVKDKHNVELGFEIVNTSEGVFNITVQNKYLTFFPF